MSRIYLNRVCLKWWMDFCKLTKEENHMKINIQRQTRQALCKFHRLQENSEECLTTSIIALKRLYMFTNVPLRSFRRIFAVRKPDVLRNTWQTFDCWMTSSSLIQLKYVRGNERHIFLVMAMGNQSIYFAQISIYIYNTRHWNWYILKKYILGTQHTISKLP